MIALRRLEATLTGTGRLPDGAAALAALGAAWASDGPVGSEIEGHLRGRAESIILRMAEVLRAEDGARYLAETWTVDVGPGIVSVRPHRVLGYPWETVIQAVRASRPHPERAEGLHALMALGARQRFPDDRIVVQSLDPETGDAAGVDLTAEDDLLNAYRAAIAAIRAGAFAPVPDARRCPCCPFLFVCGA